MPLPGWKLQRFRALRTSALRHTTQTAAGACCDSVSGISQVSLNLCRPRLTRPNKHEEQTTIMIRIFGALSLSTQPPEQTAEPQYFCWCLEDFPKILSRIHIFHQNPTQSAAFYGNFQAAARMEDVTKQNFSFGSLVHYDCVKPRRSNRGKGFPSFSICSTEFSIAILQKYPMDLVKAMAIIGYHRQVSGAPFGALFVHQPLGDQRQLPGGAAAPGSPKEPQECWAPKNRH